MNFLHCLDLRKQFRHYHLRNGHGAHLPALSPYGQHPFVEIEIQHPQFYSFEETQTAAIKEMNEQMVRIFQVFQNSINLPAGKNDRYIIRFFRSRRVLVIPEIPLQNMPEQKEQ